MKIDKRGQQNKKVFPNIVYLSFMETLSHAFKRIVIYEKQDPINKIRHYDFECEGLSLLQSIFRNKFQQLKIKAFNEIKFSFNSRPQKVSSFKSYKSLYQQNFLALLKDKTLLGIPKSYSRKSFYQKNSTYNSMHSKDDNNYPKKLKSIIQDLKTINTQETKLKFLQTPQKNQSIMNQLSNKYNMAIKSQTHKSQYFGNGDINHPYLKKSHVKYGSLLNQKLMQGYCVKDFYCCVHGNH